MKALLNDEGRKVWGYAFPSGQIPVQNAVPFKAKLGDIGEEEVYTVDWKAFTEEQRAQVIEHLKSRFGGSAAAVEAEISRKGLPLRAKYVSSVAIPGRFF